MKKQRVPFRHVSLSLLDFDGVTPIGLYNHLMATFKDNCGGVEDATCTLKADQYYEDVEISLILERLETDDEYNKRRARAAKQRARNAKAAATKKRQKAEAEAATKKAEYQTYLDLKKKFEGAKNVK